MTKDIGLAGYRGRVASDAKTLAQYLANCSYRSFLSGKWHLGTDDPTRHGFEEFYGTLVSAKTFWDPDHFLRLPPNRTRREYTAENFYGTDAVTDHAIEFLSLARKTPSRPWFLYLAYNAPHFPLQARRSDIAKYADRYHVGWDVIRQQRLARMKELGIVDSATRLSPRSMYANYGQTEQGVNPAWKDVPEPRRHDLARRMAIYAAMVDAMDQNIGRVLSAIESQGQRDSTLVIFLSDNGACAEWDPWGFDIKSSPNNILHRNAEIDRMGGRGTFHSVGSGWANASNTPWRLYKHYNHEGGIRSPCIVSWPSRVRPGGEIESTPAHVIDLAPTILEVAASEDVKAIGHATLPGVSLLPLLDRQRLADRRLFFEHEGNRAVIEGSWKLVATRGNDWELYDFSSDPTELRDLADEYPDRVELLEAAWDRWAAENHVKPLPSDYQVDYLSRP
jgi:arylsulfatase